MESRQIECTNPDYRTQEQVANLNEDKLHAGTWRTEHRSKLPIRDRDELHAQRTEHRSKLPMRNGHKLHA